MNRKKTTLLLVAALTLSLAACATAPTQMASGGYSTDAGNGIDPKKATHYRLLSDPRHAQEIDWSNPPRAAHVKGRLTTAGFQPASKIEFAGSLCTDGSYWLDLTDGSLHAAADSVQPKGPYVKGCRSKLGNFKAASAEVTF